MAATTLRLNSGRTVELDKIEVGYSVYSTGSHQIGSVHKAGNLWYAEMMDGARCPGRYFRTRIDAVEALVRSAT